MPDGYIKDLLREDEDVEAVYECKNGQEVLNFLKTKVPSILFLDINMPGLSGLEVAAQLKTTSSLIIFSTAYNQDALKAFEVEAFDYLLKPYGRERFFDVLNRAKETVERFQQAKFSEQFTALYRDYHQTISPHLTKFVVKEKGFERSIPVAEVLYIEASSVYAVLRLQESQVFYRAALNLLEQQLPPSFLRVHCSFLINKSFVKSSKYLNNSTYMVTMANDDVIISSRKYKDHISKVLSP